MARYFSLSNGNLLICLDKNARIADFYFPYVGQENHINGLAHKFGVWVDNEISWFESEEWKKNLFYKKETLTATTHATNEKQKISLEIEDIVHPKKDIYLRKTIVKNNENRERKIKLFFHQVFQIYGGNIGNTVYYNPMSESIIFYKRQRYFLINGLVCNKTKHSISDYTTGIFNDQNLISTYLDAEDGNLSNNPIEHGSVDSTISFEFDLKANEEICVYYWICVGKKNGTVSRLNEYVHENKPDKILEETETYWKNWVNKTKFNFYGMQKNLVDLFKRSLLIVSTHIDNNGAFIASGDSSTLYLKKDTYAYMWPRDGALIARSLDRCGYKEITEKFFNFICNVLTKDGYLFHKYNPDESLGSSWHPWIHDGKVQLPIQEDQIALILDALWKHYQTHKEDEYIKNIFECTIRNSANFMYNFINKKLGLPKPSYDLWEEKLGIHTFTCATVYAGFMAAYNFEKTFGTEQEAEKFLKIANTLKENIIKYFYDEKKKTFIKGIYFENDEIIKDETIDTSSTYGIFEYKILPVDDPRIKESFETIEKKLQCKEPIKGYTRYENDYYYRINREGPGNPWFITTLWVAEYYITKAKNENDLKKALEIFEWVDKHKLETGVLSEQLNPTTGSPLSVAPLTWSHAAYIIAVNKYLEKLEELGICKTCEK
ncbi:glycoside hydrolase family 15 protein [Candidatus Dependentiae bacterium]|nr:glycoside hydrolase family 15 protein [Candidatus Dependentiae bacterium]